MTDWHITSFKLSGHQFWATVFFSPVCDLCEDIACGVVALFLMFIDRMGLREGNSEVSKNGEGLKMK